MRRLILFVMCHAFAVCAMAQSYAMSEAQSLSRQIEKWVDNGGVGGRSNISRYCKKGMRISDNLTKNLAVKNEDVPLPNYELNDFLNMLQNEMDKNPHNFDIAYSDFKKAPKDKLPSDTKGYDFYVCTVTTSGSFAYTCQDLFLVKKGIVEGIAPYEEGKDQKIHVNWDDFIEHFENFGFSYNYGKHFPIGGSFNYSPEDIPFMVSVDFGVNLDGDKYIIDEVEMTDIMNYKRKKKILDPKFFLTVTPQFYIKYFAVGCGVGCLYMDGTEEDSNYSRTSTVGESGSSVSIVSGGSSSTNAVLLKPMIRPVAKGFIPLTDELSLSVSVGYDLVFGYKEKNGFNVGIGVQWEL